MALMAWDDSYSVNVREIDGQHRMLVTLMNQLHEATKSGCSNDELCEVFEEVIEYTKFHFAAEERLMREIRFPEYLLHRAVHEDMKARLADLREQCENGRRSAVRSMTLQFLRDWLISHIAVEDQAIGRYLNAHAVVPDSPAAVSIH